MQPPLTTLSVSLYAYNSNNVAKHALIRIYINFFIERIKDPLLTESCKYLADYFVNTKHEIIDKETITKHITDGIFTEEDIDWFTSQWKFEDKYLINWLKFYKYTTLTNPRQVVYNFFMMIKIKNQQDSNLVTIIDDLLNRIECV
jgi:hypothetical protein